MSSLQETEMVGDVLNIYLEPPSYCTCNFNWGLHTYFKCKQHDSRMPSICFVENLSTSFEAQTKIDICHFISYDF